MAGSDYSDSPLVIIEDPEQVWTFKHENATPPLTESTPHDTPGPPASSHDEYVVLDSCSEIDSVTKTEGISQNSTLAKVTTTQRSKRKPRPRRNRRPQAVQKQSNDFKKSANFKRAQLSISQAREVQWLKNKLTVTNSEQVSPLLLPRLSHQNYPPSLTSPHSVSYSGYDQGPPNITGHTGQMSNGINKAPVAFIEQSPFIGLWPHASNQHTTHSVERVLPNLQHNLLKQTYPSAGQILPTTQQYPHVRQDHNEYQQQTVHHSLPLHGYQQSGGEQGQLRKARELAQKRLKRQRQKARKREVLRKTLANGSNKPSLLSVSSNKPSVQATPANSPSVQATPTNMSSVHIPPTDTPSLPVTTAGSATDGPITMSNTIERKRVGGTPISQSTNEMLQEAATALASQVKHVLSPSLQQDQSSSTHLDANSPNGSAQELVCEVRRSLSEFVRASRTLSESVERLVNLISQRNL